MTKTSDNKNFSIKELLSAELNGQKLPIDGESDEKLIDCLTHPEKYAPVVHFSDCDCGDEKADCVAACLWNAMTIGEDGSVIVDPDKCSGCAACIERCANRKQENVSMPEQAALERLAARRDTVALIKKMSDTQAPVYALVAPAAAGQFGENATFGRLRSAFKLLGFTGMIEVALFADMLTLREALEFDKMIKTDNDYLLTSCCCPMWVSMIKKVYSELAPHMPPSVSPMIACGRIIKRLHPDCITVFVGPCLAKKAEAREPDVAGAVDFVLTFEETKELFEAAGINPQALEEDNREHSSRCGRIYAHTGGVSEAVCDTIDRLRPDRSIKLHSVCADGVPDCKKLLNEILDGNIKANFIEGMGCRGGCIGGPKALIDVENALNSIEKYAEDSEFPTPADNPYVKDLLEKMGIDTIEELLEDESIFLRNI